MDVLNLSTLSRRLKLPLDEPIHLKPKLSRRR